MENQTKDLTIYKKVKTTSRFNQFVLGFALCGIVFTLSAFTTPAKEVEKLQEHVKDRELMMDSLHTANETLRYEKVEKEEKIVSLQKRIDEIDLEVPKNSKKHNELADEKHKLQAAIDLLSGK